MSNADWRLLRADDAPFAVTFGKSERNQECGTLLFRSVRKCFVYLAAADDSGAFPSISTADAGVMVMRMAVTGGSCAFMVLAIEASDARSDAFYVFGIPGVHVALSTAVTAFEASARSRSWESGHSQGLFRFPASGVSAR